jgi:hypothetical protein
METLEEYLKQNSPRETFQPIAQYIPEGDCLIFHFKPDDCYAERVDSLLTVYRSEVSGDITGCQVKGVTCILKRLGDFGVQIQSQSPTVDVRLIFMGYNVFASDPNQDTIEELRQAAARLHARVESEDLIPA